MSRNLQIVVSTFAFIVLVSCTGVRSTRVDRAAGPAQFFPITEETAGRILHTAMMAEFPGLELKPLPGPQAGYAVIDDYVLEMNIISAVMIPVSHAGEDGTPTSGFAFETKYRGTLSYEGEVSIKRVFRRILDMADDYADPVPMTPIAKTSRLSLFSHNPRPLNESVATPKIDPITGFIR